MLRVGLLFLRLVNISTVRVYRRVRRILRRTRTLSFNACKLLALSPTLNVSEYVATLFNTYLTFIGKATKVIQKKKRPNTKIKEIRVVAS